MVGFWMTVATTLGRGETVAWWRFEVPRGSYLDTLVTEFNSPLLDSTLGLNGVYTAKDVPARFVSSTENGEKSENTLSLLENGSEPNLVQNPGATDFLNKIFVKDAKSWTWETFTFLRPSYAAIPYGRLFGNGDQNAHGIQFDLGPDGCHFRFLSNGKTIVQGPALDPERWYHLAVVAHANPVGDWDVELYVNHEEAGKAIAVQLDTLDETYGIAGPLNPLDGYVDEMRISDTALDVASMLHAHND